MHGNTARLSAILILVLIFSACGKKDKQYKPEERDDLMRSAELVVKATYRKILDPRKAKIDVVDARGGQVIRHVEKGVTFKVKSVLKGTPPKEEITVGCTNPNLDFGIAPGEYSGKKVYTLYIRSSSTYDSPILSGAEWEEPYS